MTLTPDLEASVRPAVRENKVGFNQALSDAIRRGLPDQPERRAERTSSRSMGTPAVNLDKALLLAASLEDDDISRKMQTGK